SRCALQAMSNHAGCADRDHDCSGACRVACRLWRACPLRSVYSARLQYRRRRQRHAEASPKFLQPHRVAAASPQTPSATAAGFPRVQLWQRIGAASTTPLLGAVVGTKRGETRVPAQAQRCAARPLRDVDAPPSTALEVLPTWWAEL